MSLVWRSIRTPLPSGHSWLGTRKVGIPSDEIPSGSLLEDIATENPGTLVRGYIVYQSGSVFFNEDGSYTEPTAPVLVIVALYVDGVFVGNRQYVLGPIPPVVDTGRKRYMSAGV